MRLIESIEDFKGISGRWDEALLKSGEDNPFLLSDFILTWWKYYGGARRLLIFVLEESDRIIGGLPLCLEKGFLRSRIIYPGGPAANITHYFSIDKEINFIQQIVNRLSVLKDWDSLVFPRVLAGSRLLKDVAELKAQNIGVLISDSGFNGLINLGGGYDSIINNLNKRLRRYLQSGKREAQNLGDLRLEGIKGSEDIHALFKEYKEFSVKSFKDRNSRSAFEDGVYGNFFEELFMVLAEKKMLDVHRFMAGEYTLAISFGYRLGKGFKWVLTAYNPDFSGLRPGHILIDFLIRETIKNGDPYFDMYYGGELFYKQQWCNRMIPLKRIEVYRRNLFNSSVVLLEKNIRSNPYLMGALRKIRDRLK